MTADISTAWGLFIRDRRWIHAAYLREGEYENLNEKTKRLLFDTARLNDSIVSQKIFAKCVISVIFC
jgi:CRISPR/Cas system-associated protein Csx1